MVFVVWMRDSYEGAREAGERGETCAVIGDAGSGEAIRLALHANIGARGKNGVEMRRQQDDAVRVGARALADHVSDFVELNFQSGGFENFLQIFGARRFFEFRRGNFGEMNLLVGDPRGILLDPGESACARGIVGKFLDRVTGGARVKCGHHQKDTAD